MNQQRPSAASPHPLRGMRVLDFSRLFPGPYCTLLLAELGASIIKIEDAERGDVSRHLPPFDGEMAVVFRQLNRGKESVALDLKTQAGRTVAQKLAAKVDVVVEGFRPGVAQRLGIDFESLAEVNRRLVYCSITGYGQEGQWRDLPGHDLTYAAMSGLLDRISPGEPIVPEAQMVDAAGALVGALRIVAALRNQQQGPQFLDISLLDAARTLMPAPNRVVPDTSGWTLDDLLRSSRNNVYRCADGRWLAISALEEHFWQKLQRVLSEMGEIKQEEELTVERLADVFLQKGRDEWFALLAKQGIPCAPVRTIEEAMPPMQSMLGSDQLGDAPALGEHTTAWLERLGYSAEEIAELREQGAIRG